MNKKLTSGLAVLAVFGLAISAVPQASAATKSIKIGLLFPTSGPMALLGTDQSVGAEMVLKWANSKGGIKGVPIEIFKADSKSSPAEGATAAQRLIDQNGVQIIIGSYSSGIAAAIAPVAQRNDVILWEVGAVSPTVNSQRYSNFLRTVGVSATYAAADYDFTVNFLAKKLGKPAKQLRIAVANNDGAFASSVGDAVNKLFTAKGLNIVAKEVYPVTSTDLTPTILKLKAASPDILFLTPDAADALLFWQTAEQQNFNVDALIGSSGIGGAGFVAKFGAAGVEGVYDVEAPALATMNPEGLTPEVAALTKEWVKAFAAAEGHPCAVHCGDGIGGAYTLVTDVLPRALVFKNTTLTSKGIIASAMRTNIKEGGTPQGFGVKFSNTSKATPGENERARSVIMQWQSGSLKVVWPAGLASSTPVAPMKTWADRK
jgi:branched-chain amino acid transport system substrate-binding protein